jgi:hypothetical protein
MSVMKRHPLVIGALVLSCLGLIIRLDIQRHAERAPASVNAAGKVRGDPQHPDGSAGATSTEALTAQHEAIAKAERSEVDRRHAMSPQGIEAQR